MTVCVQQREGGIVITQEHCRTIVRVLTHAGNRAETVPGDIRRDVEYISERYGSLRDGPCWTCAAERAREDWLGLYLSRGCLTMDEFERRRAAAKGDPE